MNSEDIKFEITFSSVYWNTPPYVDIFIDKEIKFSGDIKNNSQQVKFNHVCNFDQSYDLIIQRSGKTNQEVFFEKDGTMKDQYIIIESLCIDGIKIRDLVWSRSYYLPIYPEGWEQEREEKVYGETFFGHNGEWHFKFYSPFWKYLMDWQRGIKQA